MGWCQFYNGTLGDEPKAGGQYNDEQAGSEWNNFRVINGRVYGYVHPTLAPRRIIGNRDAGLDDVAVALFATNPYIGGQRLVGWHRHVRVNDPLEYRDRPGQNEVHLWSCSAANAVLLPSAQRTLPIPKGKGGTGQAQATYARFVDGRLKKTPWLRAVRDFILAYDGPSLTGVSRWAASRELSAQEAEAALRGQGILTNAALRQTLERYAMRRVKGLLRTRYGKDPVDVSASESYDFLCRSKSATVKVEVKATRGTGESLLFSAAEITLAQAEPVDLYIVIGIRVSGDATAGFKASGGEIVHVSDWGRSTYDAKPIAYEVTWR
jgi:hypothetical protein